MNVHVPLQSVQLSKAALTDATDERLLARMSGHVVGQVMRLSEALVTQLAAVRTVGAVGTGVPVAVVRRRESFLARVAREHVGSGHVLNAMPLQRVRVSEALRARRARVGLVSEARMGDGHVAADPASRREFDAALPAGVGSELRRRRSCNGDGSGVAERCRLQLTVVALQMTVELVGGQKPFAALQTRVRVDAAVVLQHVSLQRLPRAAALSAHGATPHFRHYRHLHLLSVDTNCLLLTEQTVLVVKRQVPARWRWRQNVDADGCGDVCVRLHVPLEREGVSELLVTHVANVVSVGAVCCHVISEMMWQSKLFPAQLTCVSSLANAAACMMLHIMCLHTYTCPQNQNNLTSIG